MIRITCVTSYFVKKDRHGKSECTFGLQFTVTLESDGMVPVRFVKVSKKYLLW